LWCALLNRIYWQPLILVFVPRIYRGRIIYLLHSLLFFVTYTNVVINSKFFVRLPKLIFFFVVIFVEVLIKKKKIGFLVYSFPSIVDLPS